MRSVVGIVCLVFVLGGLAFGQGSSCPKISIEGPTSFPSPNEDTFFRANVEGTIIGKVSFKWTVSGAEIVDGQETLTLKVRWPKGLSGNVIATFEVTGLPDSCVSILSNAIPFVIDTKPELIEEFSTLSLALERRRLDSVAARFRESSDLTIYILRYFKNGGRRREFDRIGKYLRQKGLSNKDFVVQPVEFSHVDSIKIFLVSIGGEPPQP